MSQKRILKKIVRHLAEVKDLKAVILYGSLAREDYSSTSDIDLLILTTKKETLSIIQNKILDLDIERNIQPTIRTMNELKETDTGLLLNIFQEGKILCLKEPLDIDVKLLLKQKPYLIYSFSLGNLDQKDKAKFNRELYESKSRQYAYQGFLRKINGRKLAKGCILIPYGKKKLLDRFFKKYKINTQTIKAWK